MLFLPTSKRTNLHKGQLALSLPSPPAYTDPGSCADGMPVTIDDLPGSCSAPALFCKGGARVAASKGPWQRPRPRPLTPPPLRLHVRLETAARAEEEEAQASAWVRLLLIATTECALRMNAEVATEERGDRDDLMADYERGLFRSISLASNLLASLGSVAPPCGLNSPDSSMTSVPGAWSPGTVPPWGSPIVPRARSLSTVSSSCASEVDNEDPADALREVRQMFLARFMCSCAPNLRLNI